MLAVLFRGLKDMPPVGGMMSDAQVADVVNYVRTHFGNAYPGRALGCGRCGGEATGGAQPLIFAAEAAGGKALKSDEICNMRL